MSIKLVLWLAFPITNTLLFTFPPYKADKATPQGDLFCINEVIRELYFWGVEHGIFEPEFASKST